jgi:hypothetical protein
VGLKQPLRQIKNEMKISSLIMEGKQEQKKYLWIDRGEILE